VVHLGRSTCHAISGQRNWSTRICCPLTGGPSWTSCSSIPPLPPLSLCLCLSASLPPTLTLAIFPSLPHAPPLSPSLWQVRKGSTSFGACEVRCWRWLFGNKTPVSPPYEEAHSIYIVVFFIRGGVCKTPISLAEQVAEQGMDSRAKIEQATPSTLNPKP